MAAQEAWSGPDSCIQAIKLLLAPVAYRALLGCTALYHQSIKGSAAFQPSALKLQHSELMSSWLKQSILVEQFLSELIAEMEPACGQIYLGTNGELQAATN